MPYYRFSLFLLLVSSSLYASGFSTKECLEGKFETKVEHKGNLFGLANKTLHLSKDQCLIKVEYKFILKTTWIIDICREPIHVKVSNKGIDSFYKRIEDCSDNKNDDYCQYRDSLAESLNDFGLIYAKGERELIDNDHGKLYCSSLLIKKYLDEGVLFSMYKKSESIFETKKDKASCEIPDSKPIEKSVSLPNENLQIESEPEEAPIEKEASEDKPRF